VGGKDGKRALSWKQEINWVGGIQGGKTALVSTNETPLTLNVKEKLGGRRRKGCQKQVVDIVLDMKPSGGRQGRRAVLVGQHNHRQSRPRYRKGLQCRACIKHDRWGYARRKRKNDGSGYRYNFKEKKKKRKGRRKERRSHSRSQGKQSNRKPPRKTRLYAITAAKEDTGKARPGGGTGPELG